jgi:zinc transport system substrate-binding protein
MKFGIALVLVVVAMGVGLCGCGGRSEEPAAAVAATNSLLECAVRDLLGAGTPVMRLAEPGMCPGHFDIRPSQVEALRRSRILLRFDFQKSLDDKVKGGSDGGPRITEVRITGGLCEPASYVEACRQTGAALVAAGLVEAAAAGKRQEEIAQRMESLTARCREKAAVLKDMPVVASVHQEAFCRWLGLRPVAAFTGADTAGVEQVDEAIKKGEAAGVKVVVANLPEGRRVADALGARLQATVVVFGNFPALHQGQASFDDLVEANLKALLEAAKK